MAIKYIFTICGPSVAVGPAGASVGMITTSGDGARVGGTSVGVGSTAGTVGVGASRTGAGKVGVAKAGADVWVAGRLAVVAVAGWPRSTPTSSIPQPVGNNKAKAIKYIISFMGASR